MIWGSKTPRLNHFSHRGANDWRPPKRRPICAIIRADQAAIAVLQIAGTAPPQQRQQQIEQYLRNEFADERRQAIADRELADA